MDVMPQQPPEPTGPTVPPPPLEPPGPVAPPETPEPPGAADLLESTPASRAPAAPDAREQAAPDGRSPGIREFREFPEFPVAASGPLDPLLTEDLPPVTLRTTLRRAAVGVVAGAVLVAGAVAAVPEDEEEPAPPPAPGPAARALDAVDLGYPAPLPELTALIGDRRAQLETRPSDARSWAVLGTAYVEWARRSADTAYYVRAEQALRRSLRAEPAARGNTAARVGLARLADARHDFGAARRWAEPVRARHPEVWAVYPALAAAYDGLGDRAAARAAVRRLAALRPGFGALLRTARMYRDMGRGEEAVASARDAADRADTPARKAECLYLLGELAWERGQPQEAVAQYDAVLRIDRGHRPALAGRARALAALGRTDEARRDYQAALAGPPSPGYLLELGELYESLGRDADAREQYRRLREALARDRERGVDDALLRGRFEAAHGSPAVAVRLLTAQWARSHRSAATADALGWALHMSGDSAAALPYAEQAVGAGRRDAAYVSHLGAIRRALGDFGAARRDLAEALRVNPGFSPLEAPAARRALDSLEQLPTVLPRGVRPAPAPPDESVPPTPAPRGAAPAPSSPVPAPAAPGPAPAPTTTPAPAPESRAPAVPGPPRPAPPGTPAPRPGAPA
ncbi:tetratricopeptide repeat protein [Streptomyces sp. PTD5-9]|uniref:tetratricopeptide repeat protein n=1 Tax=Streptomyces sp. PTD5-9 TaxID=3120150 RepID=UPI0030096561